MGGESWDTTIKGVSLLCNNRGNDKVKCKGEIMMLQGKVRAGEQKSVLPRLDQSSGYKSDVDDKGTDILRMLASNPKKTDKIPDDLRKVLRLEKTDLKRKTLSRDECYESAEACFDPKKVAENMRRKANLMVCFHLEETLPDEQGTTFVSSCFAPESAKK